jgi:hypothetical protein
MLGLDNILMFAAGWYRRKLVGAIIAAAIWATKMALLISIIFEDRPFRWDAPGLWEATLQVTVGNAVYCTVFYIFGYSGRAVRDRAKGRGGPLSK